MGKMPLVICRRILDAAFAACFVFSFAAPSRADFDGNGSSYALDNLVVFDTRVAYKVTSQSTRLLNVVQLDDRSPLHVGGKVAMPGNPAYVTVYGHYKQQLIVLLWDRVDIYDLGDPSSPRLVTSLALGAQDFSLGGEPLVESAGEGKFVIFNNAKALELAVDGEGRNWTARPMPAPDAAHKALLLEPPAAVLAHRGPTETPLVLRESNQFRYEIAWNDKSKPGVITHRKYLRKLDKASGSVVSQILLRTDIETID